MFSTLSLFLYYIPQLHKTLTSSKLTLNVLEHSLLCVTFSCFIPGCIPLTRREREREKNIFPFANTQTDVLLMNHGLIEGQQCQVQIEAGLDRWLCPLPRLHRAAQVMRTKGFRWCLQKQVFEELSGWLCHCFPEVLLFTELKKYGHHLLSHLRERKTIKK